MPVKSAGKARRDGDASMDRTPAFQQAPLSNCSRTRTTHTGVPATPPWPVSTSIMRVTGRDREREKKLTEPRTVPRDADAHHHAGAAPARSPSGHSTASAELRVTRTRASTHVGACPPRCHNLIDARAVLSRRVRPCSCSYPETGYGPGRAGADAGRRQPVRQVRPEGDAGAPGDGVHRPTGYCSYTHS